MTDENNIRGARVVEVDDEGDETSGFAAIDDSGDGAFCAPDDGDWNTSLARPVETLVTAILARGPYDHSDVLARLRAQGASDEAIIDHVVPQAAAALGEQWVDDELSFTRVSAATARLFGLSKVVARRWEDRARAGEGHMLLLASFRREDHLLGPGLLAQQLRRRGHSIRVLSNTDADEVGRTLRSSEYDALLVSASSLVNLRRATDEVGRLRATGHLRIPVIVGGRALDYSGPTMQDIPADLVTRDIEAALAFIAKTAGDDRRRVAK